MYGSDQAASMTIAGFEEMIGGIRTIELSLVKRKKILDIEIQVMKKLRAHIKKSIDFLKVKKYHSNIKPHMENLNLILLTQLFINQKSKI